MPGSNLANIGVVLGNAVTAAGTNSAKAAAVANGVSFASQAAQGAFNQQSANIANTLGDQRTAQQYAFNSGAAADANQFTEYMWDKSAAWNEKMLERQMEFNAQQAQINRDWQEKMRSTAYQTAIKDMETAGLNPILAVMNGGTSVTGNMSGSTASASMPTMSGATGAMAQGGLLNGLSASEGNFAGQMEYMGGMIGLISTVFAGLSSAMKGLGNLGDFGEGLGNALGDALKGNTNSNNFNPFKTLEEINEAVKNGETDPVGFRSGIRNGSKIGAQKGYPR